MRVPRGEEKEEALHAFFSWTDDGEGDWGVASFNPGCLRWQVRMSFLVWGEGWFSASLDIVKGISC